VVIHPFACIGDDAFSFERTPGNPPIKKRVNASVVIGDHVEIYAGAIVDPGIERDTTLGNHVKIDHGAHVGHDSIVGDRTVICSQAFIGGFVEIGEDCYIGAEAAIKPRVKIGAGARIGMNATVLCDVPAGVVVKGIVKA